MPSLGLTPPASCNPEVYRYFRWSDGRRKAVWCGERLGQPKVMIREGLRDTFLCLRVPCEKAIHERAENAEASFVSSIHRQWRRSFCKEAHATSNPGSDGDCQVQKPATGDAHWPVLFLWADNAGVCTEFRLLWHFSELPSLIPVRPCRCERACVSSVFEPARHDREACESLIRNSTWAVPTLPVAIGRKEK